MNKLCSFLLVLCFLFSLTACVDNETATDNDASTFCAECGEEISVADKFCRSCGASVEKATTNSSTTGPSSADSSNGIEEDVIPPEKKNIELFMSYAGSCLGEVLRLPESEKEFLSHVIDYCRCRNYVYDIVITDDGSAYHLSLDKKFSNGTHHKKIETDLKFVKFLRGCFISSDNKAYVYDDETNVFEQHNFSSEFLDGLQNENLSNVFAADGSFYRMSENTIYSFENECIHRFPSEEIIQFVHDGTIKTSVCYYQVGEIYTASEYADVEGTYEIKAIPCSLPFDCNYIKFDRLVDKNVVPAIIIVDNYIYLSLFYRHTSIFYNFNY